MYNEYEVGERLAKIRENKGFSQEALAEKIGCSVITISRWENGQSNMKAVDAYNICTALNVSTDLLLGMIEENDNHGTIIYEEMLEGLNDAQRTVVLATLTSMVDSMKKVMR